MSLCLECGLCCDGSMFADAVISAEEAERLAGRVAVAPSRDRLVQPCVALGKGGCGVYADRPHTCRVYRCVVLGQLEEGQLSLEEAREAIGELKARRARVAAAMGLEDERAALAEARRRHREKTLEEPAKDVLRRYEQAVLILQLPVEPSPKSKS